MYLWLSWGICGLRRAILFSMEREMTTNEELAAFLDGAAGYFERRSDGGEDMAFWANVMNAERCREAATRLRKLEGAGEGVRVKPLEWHDHTKGPGCPIRRIARPFEGHVIWIFQYGEPDYWCLSYNNGINGRFLVRGDEDAAKAAAQADYEARIRELEEENRELRELAYS